MWVSFKMEGCHDGKFYFGLKWKNIDDQMYNNSNGGHRKYIMLTCGVINQTLSKVCFHWDLQIKAICLFLLYSFSQLIEILIIIHSFIGILFLL